MWNVLLVVVDTARADDAYDPDVMPTMHRLGRSGTRYRNAFATAPWTLPSHAALFTGTYSSTHGAHGANPALDATIETLPEAFRNAGYETMGASNNTWISGEFGFDRGFESFWRGWQLIQSEADVGSIFHELGTADRVREGIRTLARGNPVVNAINATYSTRRRARGDYGATRTTAHVTDWLESRDRSRPFFGFINYLEPHVAYKPPDHFVEPFLPPGATVAEAKAVRQDPRAYDVGAYSLSEEELALLRALYRGELAYTDRQLAALRGTLTATDQWENTVLIVCGDHGENIGDHDFLGHQYNVYDTLLHVPLVITGGPFADGGDRSDLVQLADLVPTLLDTTEIHALSLATQTQGKSMHPESDAVREYAIAEYMAPQPPVETLRERYGPLSPAVEAFDRQLRTVRSETEKLICGSDGMREYYRVDRDPSESQDLANRNGDRVAALERVLEERVGAFDRPTTRSAVTASRSTKRHLADLGYL